MDFVNGLPFPAAVGVLFVIVFLRAGATYALGRAAYAGADRTRLRHLLGSPRFVRAQALLGRWGAPAVAASFLTVGLQTVINLAAGLGRMPLRRYVPALVVGGALWAVVYATIGLTAFAGLARLWQWSPAAAGAVVLLLVAAVVAYVMVHRRRARTVTRAGASDLLTDPATDPATSRAADPSADHSTESADPVR